MENKLLINEIIERYMSREERRELEDFIYSLGRIITNNRGI